LLQQGIEKRVGGYRGRFAPSPTGPLHLGNLRTALVSWLDARSQGGQWFLRLDDLDSPRNRAGATDSIIGDLQWLGLTWDGSPVFQGKRRGLYASVLSALRRGGFLYPCRCSRRLLADISAPHGRLSVYPGFCRGLMPLWGPQNQRLPSWRLRLPDTTLLWTERVAAQGRMDGIHQVGDLVLRRADGLIAYHLATAVDELALGISDVVRGADLWTSTGAQVAVMGVLGHAPPRYGHVPLWHDKQGQRLSKREGSAGIAGLRARGLDAPGVIGLLAASAGLVPEGSRLSSNELLQQLHGTSILG
jgi:glutamyl-tRNA synthetase